MPAGVTESARAARTLVAGRDQLDRHLHHGYNYQLRDALAGRPARRSVDSPPWHGENPPRQRRCFFARRMQPATLCAVGVLVEE